MISESLLNSIRTVDNFPKPGVSFKDLTPVYQNSNLCSEIVNSIANHFSEIGVQAVVGIESRGFIFGAAVAFKMGLPFIPVRKKGKLPFAAFSQEYELEYGVDVLEMHIDAFPTGAKILVHDDVLATGGTANAVKELVKQAGGEVLGYSFILELAFLNGRERLGNSNIQSLIVYN